MHLTYIEWDDAHSPPDAGWFTVGSPEVDITVPMRFVSVGFVTAETDAYVQLSATVEPETVLREAVEGAIVSGIVNIPVGMIHKRVEIKIPKRLTAGLAKAVEAACA